MTVIAHPLEKMDKRANGIEKVNLAELPIPKGFNIKEQVLLLLPPSQIGGNHKHSRKELFFTLNDDVVIVWVDAAGEKHERIMKEGDHVYLFEIPSGIPHAVQNRSATTSAILLEFADGPLENVVPHPIL
jgi:uncharacterized RmlC-like cupin family protein